MEAMNAMIHDQEIPMHLWGEEARTTIYVQKRISHSALGFKTPEEMFTGKKPKVSHLKISLSTMCSYSKREKNQVRSFRK